MMPESSLYNLAGGIRLSGRLDVAALERSLLELRRRHEALRTTFVVRDEQPVQHVAESVDSTLAIEDLGHVAVVEREHELQGLATQWSLQPFDLTTGPLLRVMLVRMSDDEHVFLIAMHHIICDGWSIGVFVRELTALYAAFVTGKPSPLPELPIQYADYAQWQRAWLQGDVLESQLAYWRRQLAGPLPVLELPCDRSRPAIQTFNGALRWFRVPKSVSQDLEALSHREGATPFMTLLAAFKVLLYRYTGQTDLVVGSPIANRNRVEIENSIGFFVNSLALRTVLSGDLSFREVLARVREVALGGYAHQDVPFERLVEELHVERSTRYSPLFQVMFALQTAPRASLQLPGLTVRPFEMERLSSKFDLTLSMQDSDDGLIGVFEYNTDLFDASTIERVEEHFRILLKGIVADPARRISELPLLGEVERAQVVEAWNATASEYPREATVAELFEAQAAARPDTVAVVCGKERLSYGALNARAEALAQALGARGVGPGVRVGVLAERSVELVVGLVGILKAGGTYVPLEVDAPAARLAALVADAGVGVVVTQTARVAQLPPSAGGVICVDAVGPAPSRGWVPPRGTTAEDLAYVIYTSGSTGMPKGVEVTNRAVVRLVCGSDYVQVAPGDVVAQASTAAFDAATFEVWGALLNGATLVVLPKAELLVPEALGTRLRADGVTVLFVTTALFNQVAREAPAAFGGLRHLLFGGEAVDPVWVRQVLTVGRPARLLHVYGRPRTRRSRRGRR